MTFHTRNANPAVECEIEPMRQLWAAVIDQAVMDATTRSEEWFDAIDFLMTSRSDMQLGIIGLDADSFRLHLLKSMHSTESNRINPTRKKNFVANHIKYIERKRQTSLF